MKKTIALFICAVSLCVVQNARALELKSPAFEDNTDIAAQYTCEGTDISPELRWSDAPADTKSFVLICDDPDAPVGVWTHWVVYDIPSTVTMLSRNIAKKETLPDGTSQGLNDFGKIGYGGPCPPHGKAHHYVFKLYALKEMLHLKPGLSKQEVLRAIEKKIIQEARFVGIYQR